MAIVYEMTEEQVGEAIGAWLSQKRIKIPEGAILQWVTEGTPRGLSVRLRMSTTSTPPPSG